jgi:hypothetical protein
MPPKNRFAEMQPEIAAWRRDLHQHPEILFEVHRTAGLVAERLRAFGCDEVVTGLGRTGVVGVIRGARPLPAAPSACAPTWTRCPSRRQPTPPGLDDARRHARLRA